MKKNKMKQLQFSSFSKYRGELMGIAIIGVCLLHAFALTGLDGRVFQELSLHLPE